MYRLLAILGTLIGVSLLLLLLQRDVIAGYMSAVNGVRTRLNEAYDGTLALYQASTSAMQMTVFFGFILFLLAGLLSAGICYRTNPAVVLAGAGAAVQNADFQSPGVVGLSQTALSYRHKGRAGAEWKAE